MSYEELLKPRIAKAVKKDYAYLAYRLHTKATRGIWKLKAFSQYFQRDRAAQLSGDSNLDSL